MVVNEQGISVDGESLFANLTDLLDVDVPAPSDGDVVTWDSGTSSWVSEPPTGGGTFTFAYGWKLGVDA